ncbi:MAG: hypothetical protein ACP5GJ_01540 [Nanopusillaceae archaeon]
MCGIIGIISNELFDVSKGVKRLKRLEYRGYDSFGFYANDIIYKKVGKIEIPDIKHNTWIFIGHTRWATHGGVNEINAHPHIDCTGNIIVVHNGTIDNYKELREYLEKEGHKFRSETDSEIFAHWFEDRLKKGKDIKEIVLEIFNKFKGTYALIVYIKNLKKIIAIKNGSPLVIGIKDNKIYIASDVYAFLDDTENVITLNDYEFAIIEK